MNPASGMVELLSEIPDDFYSIPSQAVSLLCQCVMELLYWSAGMSHWPKSWGSARRKWRCWTWVGKKTNLNWNPRQPQSQILQVWRAMVLFSVLLSVSYWTSRLLVFLEKISSLEVSLSDSRNTVAELEQNKRLHESERRKLHNTIQELKVRSSDTRTPQTPTNNHRLKFLMSWIFWRREVG